jgi:hypothetical protein
LAPRLPGATATPEGGLAARAERVKDARLGVGAVKSGLWGKRGAKEALSIGKSHCYSRVERLISAQLDGTISPSADNKGEKLAFAF